MLTTNSKKLIIGELKFRKTQLEVYYKDLKDDKKYSNMVKDFPNNVIELNKVIEEINNGNN